MEKVWTTLAIILSVFTLGFLLVFGARNIDVTINMSPKEKNPTNTSDTQPTQDSLKPDVENDSITDNAVSPETSVPSNSLIPQGSSIISGKLCYPSDGIPPLTLYLKNTKTDKIITKSTVQNQSNYDFLYLAEGSYEVFAKVKGHENEEGSIVGGYTPAVECGLTVECTNHDLIEINLEPGAQFENADICDWYGVKLGE